MAAPRDLDIGPELSSRIHDVFRATVFELVDAQRAFEEARVQAILAA